MNAILTAQSTATDPRAAAREIYAGIAQPDTTLVLFFCSSHYDRDSLADEINRQFGTIPVIGCTTAGEIGPLGYLDHSLVGVSFPAATCTAVTDRIGDLQRFAFSDGFDVAQALRQRLTDSAPAADTSNSFALLLVDGLSFREEPVTRALQNGLGDLTLIGGSAGDDLKFEHSWVFHQGAFHRDSALLALVSTRLPFQVFKTQHFISLEERLVVTDADPECRRVREINNLPAAEEYARIVGVVRADLDPAHFAASPVVVLIDGTDYVRSIQKVEADGSLVFYCAIEEGMVLRVAHGVDLESDLEHTLARLRCQLGPPQLMLACDCILRNLEVTERGTKARVAAIFQRHNAVGFSTYGEQYGGVHVNQTLTGIAIGAENRAKPNRK